MIDTMKIRNDFPIFQRKINGKPIIYLDSTATSLKPKAVIEAMNGYYAQYSSNIFRGIYTISEEATKEYEDTRLITAKFINAPFEKEIIFTRNTTESINVVAYAWARKNVKKGDHIIVPIMEHHSNFVPWQQMAKEYGWVIDYWENDSQGVLDVKYLDKKVTRRTKLLTITAVSNVLGTINPIGDIVKKVKSINPDCRVLVDAAQAAPHMPIDVQAWDADWVVFSSHKMLGPTGVGVLWGRYELLDSMDPFLYGGEMIQEVHKEKTLFKKPPYKFEAGTPDIAGVIGFKAAIKYLMSLGMENIRNHEKQLVSYALKELAKVTGVTVYGPKNPDIRGGVLAFTMKQAHAHDIAQIVNEDNICIRSGNHCAMPLHVCMDIRATARASLYIYTTKDDIDQLIFGLQKVITLFG